jgi:hypothetical protein
MEAVILEKTSKFARFGGPIQLASNALATIKGIDEGVFDRVRQCGPLQHLLTSHHARFSSCPRATEEKLLFP